MMTRINRFIEDKMLNQVNIENYFVWKKSKMLFELISIFLFVLLFIITPVHCLDFRKHPMLVVGDF